MRTLLTTLLLLPLLACNPSEHEKRAEPVTHSAITQLTLIVLGTVQDAGSPHVACTKKCCRQLFQNPDAARKVVSLGIIDPENEKSYLFEATPDLPTQMKMLKNSAPFSTKETPDGIFLSHAHIGHYAGLMYLGREAMSADSVPVFAMPRMKSFLETNGPWSQLISRNNIVIQPLQDSAAVTLTSNLRVTPFLVPHRDEFSETVGYTIEGPNKSALFIPDIDKWERWKESIIDEIARVDYALLDATFFDGEELNNRDMSEIPHPFIVESMELFSDLPASEKDKVYFIHFNHTNPVLDKESAHAIEVLEGGFHLAEFGMVLEL